MLEEDVKCKSFMTIYINSLFVFEKKYNLRVYFNFFILINQSDKSYTKAKLI